MATIQTNTIFSAQTGKQRETQLLSDVDHDRVANAIRYLSYAKLYYPLEYGFFTKSLVTRGATESMEDSNYILALYDFESYFSGFLHKHPGTEQDVNRLSPKEMVDRVNKELVEDAQARRDAIKKASQRIVNKAIEQQGLRLNKGEKAEAEKTVGTAIEASIDGASTTKGFVRSVEEGVAPAMLTQIPTVNKDAVTQIIGSVLRENPKEIQQIFLSDETSQKEILKRTVFSRLPNKRALQTIIATLPMDPDETREQFLDRAEATAGAAMVISSDISQSPVANTKPSNFVSAILETGGNRGALAAFEKLSEQARGAVSLVTVSQSWERAVAAITQRAGGAVTPALEAIINEGNRQWGNPSGKPLGSAGSAVSGLLGEILSPAFVKYINAKALLGELGGKEGDRVMAFINSLPATRRGEGAATAALFLGAAVWKPEGVWHEQHPVEGLVGTVTWVVHWATDSAFGTIVRRAVGDGAAKGLGGFFGPILGFFGIRAGSGAAAGAAGTVAGKAATGGLIKIFGSLVGALSGPWGWVVSIVGGLFAAPLLDKAKEWLGKLFSGRFGQLDTMINALGQVVGARGGGGPDAQKNWYEKTWVLILLLIGVAVLIPMYGVFLQFTSQSSPLFVASQSNQPEGFKKFDQTFSQPPEYINPSLFIGREFNCLSFGQGLDTGEGVSRGLTSGEVDRITSIVSKYPQINLLSCGLSCPSRKINITAFSEPSDYGGFAPALRPGNVILYQHTFTGYDDQTFAYLLLHEFAHQHDWFNTPVEAGFGSLGCGATPPSTYGYAGNSAEAFAESVALYLINSPEIKTYCDGKAYNYLNGAFNQCR